MRSLVYYVRCCYINIIQLLPNTKNHRQSFTTKYFWNQQCQTSYSIQTFTTDVPLFQYQSHRVASLRVLHATYEGVDSRWTFLPDEHRISQKSMSAVINSWFESYNTSQQLFQYGSTK